MKHVAPSSRTVVVVGAGAFGAASALELRSRGWQVTLVDRAGIPHPDASSTDISKMIRMDYGSDVFYHELAEAALDGWERWNREWPRPLYHAEGFLVLAPGPMEPGGFEYESYRVLRERGYHPERLDRHSLAERYPAWAADRYPDGYVSPRGGWAESGAVVERLLLLCDAAGVDRRMGRFESLMERGSTVGGVRLADGGTVEAERVVVSAGAWTPVLLPRLAGVLRSIAQPVVHFGVEPSTYQGQQFPPYAADTSGSGWYGFPAIADGRLKLGHHGEGREVHPDDRGEVGPDHIEKARAFLAHSIPALAGAPVVGTRICLYCDSFDGDLLVDRDPERDGLVVASGGSGHGFKFTPVLGTIVADVVEGRENRWARRFRWRTGGTPKREQARLQGTAES
jgi:glycine/D-amino acid oxidase-like deaminating enzyme